MLGLQETRPTGTPATKTYSCVGCSATFSGLASLLVHQASHAIEVSNPPVATSPTCSHCGSMFVSNELLEKHCCTALPQSNLRSVFKSECEEEFQERDVMQEHEKFCEMETVADSSDTNFNMDVKTPQKASPFEPVEVPSCENSPSPLPTSTEKSLQPPTSPISEDDRNDCSSPSDTPSEHCQASCEAQDTISLTCPLTPPEAEDQPFENDAESVKAENENICVIDSDESSNQSHKSTAENETLLKIVASTSVSHRQPDQITWGQKMRAQPPRKVSPRAPFHVPTAMATTNSDWAINLLTHDASNQEEHPSVSKPAVKPSKTFSKKSMISTTKTLCPVVVLETHQKLIKDNIEGRHQCGFCRRVFQDKDSLIMHHALHRKERVKFCRRCQQFVISITSVPDSHVCFDLRTKTSTFVSTALHPKKLYHCLLCNRSYTRRYRLRTHNCQGMGAPLLNDNVYPIKGESDPEEPPLSMNQQLMCQANVGVNTEVFVKTEENTESILDLKYQTGFGTKSSQSLMKSDALSKITLIKNGDETLKKDSAATSAIPVKEGEKNTVVNESLEGQWTVPLDDAEVDVLVDDNCDALDESGKENPDDEVVFIDSPVNSETNSMTSNRDFQVHVSEVGVKRFSCNRCQKTYSRRFTLIQHLKLCRTGKLVEPNSSGKTLSNILAIKKKFPCPSCGVLFTRKDNMNMHRKRCQLLRRPNTVEGYTMLQKQNQATSDNVFVLPPGSTNQDTQEGTKNNTSGGSSGGSGGSWGIMSLPSVLPRKVTCECGAAFTCPRLLFEHLQMHALETYICSLCGENLRSWAAFEAHQRLHVQPSQQKAEPKGSQQQQSHVQPQQMAQFKLTEQNLKKEPQSSATPHLNYKSFIGPYVCHRCKKVFRRRKYLLKHLRLSCKGEIAIQHKHSCSRCGMIFQNSVALEVHMRGNTCTPAFKPLRCPVCVSWFSSLEGLKRHLMSHSQKEDLTCQICGCKCLSHSALEEHKKSSHGVNKATELTAVNPPQILQSSSTDVFRCQICQRSYAKLQSLKDHLRKVHRPKGLLINAGMSEAKSAQQSQFKLFQCQICARTYPDNQSLKNHKRRVHHVVGGGLHPSRGTLQQSHFNQFQCQICSRSYPDITSLRNHRRRVHHILGGLGLGVEVHKGIVHQIQDHPFKCQICQRSYRNLASLKDHKRKVHQILRDPLESSKEEPAEIEQSQLGVLPVIASSDPVSQD